MFRTAHTAGGSKPKKVIVAGIASLLLAASPWLAATAQATGGYAATDVLGQVDGSGNPDFTLSNTGNGPDQLDYPTGSAIDPVHHRLFVGVAGSNYRVDVYDLDSNNMPVDHTADYILGQPDFATDNNETTQNGGAVQYAGVAYDPSTEQLFVSDQQNSRVLVYDLSGGITDGMNASYVLGQPDFVSSGWSLDASGMNYPANLALDTADHRLFVADYYFDRVLVFNVNPATIATGEAADYVLGEPDFTTDNTVITQNSTPRPNGLAYNPTTQMLFVGTYSRVLAFDLSGGITNGMDASYVLGQSAYTTNDYGTTQHNLFTVTGLATDPQRNLLYVSDKNNNRVLVFDLSGGITNDMDASLVLGQPDFVSNTAGTSQVSMDDPEGDIAIDPATDHLYVADANNNRVLIYAFAQLPSPLPNPTVGVPYTQSLAARTQGTATYAVVSGKLPVGLSLASATGVISGTPTIAGKFTFGVVLGDSVGPAGTATDMQTYNLEPGGTMPGAQLTNTGTNIALSSGLAAFFTGSALFIFRKRAIYRLRNYR